MSIYAVVLIFGNFSSPLFAQSSKNEKKLETIQLEPSVVEGRRPDSEELLDDRFSLETDSSPALVKRRNELEKSHKKHLDSQEKIADKVGRFEWGGFAQSPQLKRDLERLEQDSDALEVSEKEFVLDRDIERDRKIEQELPEGNFEADIAH